MHIVFYYLYTAVLWVCMRTFLTLPFRDRVGEVPLKPGFWIPSPPTPPPAPFPLADRGFFRLDRNGLRITGVIVDPFELSVVVIEIVLPLVAPLKYGFPLASVTDILPLPPTPAPPPPPPENIKSSKYNTFYIILDYVLTTGSLNNSILKHS